jgi:hypothetical protein
MQKKKNKGERKMETEIISGKRGKTGVLGGGKKKKTRKGRVKNKEKNSKHEGKGKRKGASL